MRARFAGPIYPLSNKEEIDLNFDLAATLAAQELDDLIEVLNKRKEGDANFDENVPADVPFEAGWSMPKKVIYLYNEIPRLDEGKDKRDSALALLGKGLWLRSYRQRMDGWARKYDAELKKTVTRPYPFDHLEAIDSWRELVEKYPNNEVAPQTQILIAQTFQQQNDLVKARAAYLVVIEKFPKSKWVRDARASLQQIEKHEISLDTMGAQAPGVKAKLTYNARNINTLQLAAYPIALEKYLARPEKVNNEDVNFTEFGDNFGSIEQIVRELGAPVAQWEIQTGDKNDYQPRNETIDTPLQNLGAYIIVARDKSRPQVLAAARLMLISDLAILKKVDRKNAFAFLADAKSGRALSGVNTIVKEIYNTQENGTTVQKVDAKTAPSNDGGFVDKALKDSAERYNNSRVSVFAWRGKSYALTGNGYNGYWWGDRNQEFKIYGYADRTVYRPAQKVYWRFVVSQQDKGGDQKAAANRRVQITINDPKGQQLLSKTFDTSEFGSVNGELDLPQETPLGNYSLNAALVDDSDKNNIKTLSNGGASFRVEEYKRPEFEVTVDAPDEAVRPGETIAAKISAKYYFGSPVANATVKYTVRRRNWWASYRFPTPYDWLLDRWNVSWNPWDDQRRNLGGEGSGPIIKEGTAKTDAQGNAEVTFVAATEPDEKNDGNYWWRSYSNPLYAIEVEVTDSSRRTIEGSGAVKVASQDYFAFLDAKRGFYQEGDRVQIEIVTRNANDKPVAATGKMVVYRLLEGDKEEKVSEEAVTVDKTGRAFWEWQSVGAGQFRIAWQSVDAQNNEVKASITIWIDGPKLNQTEFRQAGLTIVLDKRVYEEGDVAKVLLVADKPDTTVLLTQESSGEILRRDVITIEGKSRQIEISITHDRVPNFAIAAALVKDYQVFQAQQEVFVPPVRALLNVQVKGDKAEYKPGETGTFEIEATDYAGRPARGEFSLAVTDASLFYIQQDTSPDVRGFFYGERRPINVQLDSSRSGNGELFVRDNAKYQEYDTHGWELPDGFGMLQLNPEAGGYYPYYNQRGALAGGFGGGARNEPMAFGIASDSIAPLAAAAPVSRMAAAKSEAAPSEAAPLQQAQVRSNFAETALWSPAVVTENGKATVKVTFPDSLTKWHVGARGITQNAQVGAAESDVETRKNLLVRLQAPRFFVERDQVVLTANVHNYLPTKQRVKVALETGDNLKINLTKIAPLATGTNLTSPESWVEIEPNEEARINWTVDVVKDGSADVQMIAQSTDESDAVKMNFPVLVHGAQRFAAQAGIIRNEGAQSEKVTINFPKERKFGSSNLNVQLNPSMAATMLDALPYLADYPYGCVEQTVSRFVPSVLVAKTLRDSGVDLQVLAPRAATYKAESQTEAIGERVKNSGYTYPKGQPNARDLSEMASRLWYHGRAKNPIYDAQVLASMIDDGLGRLYAMQRDDGGWGWWQGSPQSDEYMSAYVMYGLAIARDADVQVRPQVLARGFTYLDKQLRDEDNLQLLTMIAHSLTMQPRNAVSADSRKIITGRLFEQRARLTPYSQSLLAIALHNIGANEQANVLVRNLENTVKIDAENGTAHWQMQNQWWYWWNNDEETNAVALRTFLQIDPDNKLVPMLSKWLVTRSRANHWQSTKATALTVYALADFVRIKRELDVDYTIRVNLNDKIARTYRVNAQNALDFDNRFIVGDLFLNDGNNTLTIEKQGRGNVYWSAYSEYFSLEEPIKASGNEIAIKRRYFKLTRNPNVKAQQSADSQVDGVIDAPAARRFAPPIPVPQQPAEQEYNRSEIADKSMLQSGDLVEVELTIDSKNDYEYLVFEDMKAAGLEAQDIRSGSSWGDGLSSNVELRDEKVAFFVDRLPQGTRVLRYRMRVEIPGRFHALPTNGYAMYAPEVRAISDEMRLDVKD